MSENSDGMAGVSRKRKPRELTPLQRALALLVRREHSRKELARKLGERGIEVGPRHGVEREVPGREPRVLPGVGHGQDVVGVEVAPPGVSAVGPFGGWWGLAGVAVQTQLDVAGRRRRGAGQVYPRGSLHVADEVVRLFRTAALQRGRRK